jgi:hypothetical protein
MKRTPIGNRMQSFMFEFEDEDGKTEVISDTTEGGKPSEEEEEDG